MRPHRWIIPIAAMAAVAPLAWWGPSCGKDMMFHLQSWLDVAEQMRHGVLLPRWNFLSAYDAGEPRYIFYPPVSWLLGGGLTLALPLSWVATVVSWLAMCVAGFGMRRLVAASASLSTWASPFAAIVAACVYLANPFLVFSIAARSAYGEIFAAALLPWMMAALLCAEPEVVALALALAGIWLSNVPGGVMAAYLYGAMVAGRLLWGSGGSGARLRMLWKYACGALLAVALDAFYLLPAWHQRALIHAGEPFVFPLRPTDSLFFSRVLLSDRDDFLLRVGHLAAAMALTTFVLLGIYWIAGRRRRDAGDGPADRALWMSVVLAIVVCFMLTAPAAFLWRSLPGLYILQFPWRLLLVLAVPMAIAVALVLRRVQMRPWASFVVSMTLVAVLAIVGFRLYIAPCGAAESPAGTRERLLVLHHAPEPIDEYVMADTASERMRPDNPPFWLVNDPRQYAPGTTPNSAMIPGGEMSAVPESARLSATPLVFSVRAVQAGFVVVNLQAYPNWRVTRNGADVSDRPTRSDGLLVVPVEAGESRIAIRWRHGWDEVVGGTVSLLAAALMCVLAWGRRRYAAASS